MNKLILVLFGILFATATAKQFATSVYANDFANAAAAQYSTGNTLAYSDFAAPLGVGWGYPAWGYPVWGYPYDLGYWGYPSLGYWGAPVWGGWGSPVVATDVYANSYNNAAAAQYSAGNTLAYSNLAAPLGIWFKRH